ncbi:hypothetical protein BGZ98_007080 [Dissophora globulifera]|nr:hypothetical protein BGZ98_007080 [Dissophora globulifera]
MRPPFPSAAQAYAESIHSDTASRHHPDARLTILPLPSLAALYPLDDTHLATSSNASNASSASQSVHGSADTPFRPRSQLPFSSQHSQHSQPAYQSYDGRYQKTPASVLPSAVSSPSSSSSPATPEPTASRDGSLTPARSNKHEYLGTSMESLLNAVEVHSTMLASSSASSSGSPSPSTSSLSLSSVPSSPTSPAVDDDDDDNNNNNDDDDNNSDISDFATEEAAYAAKAISLLAAADSHATGRTNTASTGSSPFLGRIYRPRMKHMLPRPCSPSLGPNHVTHKRKWSRLSTHTSEDPNRSPKTRRMIPVLVENSEIESLPRAINMSIVAEELEETAPRSSSSSSSIYNNSNALSGNSSNSNGSIVRGHGSTIISCYHASVAQKSYGSEKRFLCPPPIVHIEGQLDESGSGMINRPQVIMSIICESGENSNVGQRSTLEDDQSSTFRYLYVSGTAKAKSFQLKLQVYGRSCLPNGFVPSDSSSSQASETTLSLSDLSEPIAEFDSQPIAIISKPSKKTAKARNVSSCILAGSLVSLFNRINSQTVRTKYMSAQDGELCAKSSSWSAFTISIVANGPSCPAPGRSGSTKSHHRQPTHQNATPITYGSEIILTETTTGMKSDRLVVCKVENGRILQGAIGPICQMQKVALHSIERSAREGQPMYLGAAGDDHQSGRFMDHSTASSTVLRYKTSTMTETSKSGSDDFLCWTIVGISKFDYAVDLP